MTLTHKLLYIEKFNTSSIYTIFEYVNKYANSNVESNDCCGKTLCNVLSGSETELQFDKAMKKLGGNTINVYDYTIVNNNDSSGKPIKTDIHMDIAILSENNLCQMYSIATRLQMRFIYSNIAKSLVDLYTIHQHVDFINYRVKILLFGDPNNTYIQAMKYLLNMYPNVVITFTTSCNNNDDNVDNYDIIYYAQSSDNICSLEEDICEIEKMAKSDTFIIYRLPDCNMNNEKLQNMKICSLYKKQTQNDIYVRMSLIYVCLFNLLDNTFDTLEYNYLNQLQSEIHHW